MSGEILWKNRFDYQSQHGAGGSPIVYGDLLIFNCDGSDAAFVIALDKNDRQDEMEDQPRFSVRPGLHDAARHSRRRPRSTDQRRRVSRRAYDPLTGKEIWRVRYDEGFSNVPRPVFAHGLVVIATGFQQPELLAVRPGWDGRRDQDPHRVVAEAWRSAHAVAAHRR